MNSEIYYFTGTGNSLVVAKDIARILDGELISIPSTIEKETITTTADIVGIIFPVFYADFGGIPLILKRFVKKLKIPYSTYLFAVCTHAGGPRKTIEQLQLLLEQKGIKLASGFAIQLSVPYSPGLKMKRALFRREINSGEEVLKDSNKQKELYDAWEKKLKIIIKSIKNREEGIFETTRSPFKPLVSLSKFTFRSRYKNLAEVSKQNSEGKTLFDFEDLIHLADKSFSVNEKCNGCGICSKLCPVGNIKMVNNSPVWQHRCETCYACYVWCPNDAVYGEIVAYNKKYHHPDVKLSEIINQFKTNS